MWIRPPLLSDLPALVLGMCDQDAREIYALRPNKDPFALVGDLVSHLPYALTALVAGVDGEPNAIAFLAVWPKGRCEQLGDAALFATPKFGAIARDLIANIRQIQLPAMLKRGVRRVEARAMVPHKAAHAFLTRCGAVRETTLQDFGPDGLDYVLFAWRASDFAAGCREEP